MTEHVENVCQPGKGGKTCRYLIMGAKGWECAKHTGLATLLDARVESESMVARGNNCEGVGNAELNEEISDEDVINALK